VPFTVTIANGLNNIVLPNGGTYMAGDTAVLSDEQYSVIKPSVSALIFSSVVGSGGGSGSSIKVSAARIITGDIPLPNTSGAWAALRDTSGTPALLEVSVPAAVGNWVEVGLSGMAAPSSTSFLDVAAVVGSTLVRYMSSGTGTPSGEGLPSLYPQPSSFRTFGPSGLGFVVASGDLDTGRVRFIMAVKATGTGTLYASATYPFYMRALNLGS
jgi:hypothetical protein